MEPPPPPPLAKYIARKSRERFFSGDSSSLTDHKTVQIMPSTSHSSSSKKLKLSEVFPLDIIEIDGAEGPTGVLIIDEKIDMSNKGKAIEKGYDKNWQKQVKDALSNDLLDPIIAADPGSIDDVNPLKSFSSRKSIDLNVFDSDLSHYDGYNAVDDDADLCDYSYYDDCIYEDDYLSLQAQFDSVGLPPGVEATVPWLQVPDLSKNKASDLSSSVYSSLQNQFCAVGLPHALETSVFSWDLCKGKMKAAATSSSTYSSTQVPFNVVHGSSGIEASFLRMHNSSSGQKPTATSSSTVPIVSIEEDEEESEVLKKIQPFKQFDTVQGYSDHQYTRQGSSLKQPSKNWTKRIQEEWKILEKDLPDKIFVRVYEARMDLLRAVIVGAAGTPYHDGLFFFDIFFPSDYPNVPPQVYYHSGGLRLNPNLYDNGKVCLSLLNTWNGSRNEKWIPGKSTMLQVLVSIQALILNAKPFFNEPGYERMYGRKEGERRSEQYNEETFLKSLQTMLYTLRRPPNHFEDFVAGHFHKHAHDILVACKAYMEGAQVGCLAKGGVQDVDEGDKSCSKPFQLQVAGKLKLLVPAFIKNGSKGCEPFLLSLENGNKLPDTKLKL